MIGWRDGDGREHRGTLFATFAALANGEAWSFPALRPHQREPWHAFTVQVAAMAMIRAGRSALPECEAAWRDLLMGLTPDCPEAWELVVDDWSKPALLQPPTVAAGDRAAYRNRLPTPDALDMLVTAKNHDVKAERYIEAADEDWLFALVTLQTASAYGGAKTYGISRMNGKTGSRLIMRLRPRGGFAAAFQRDVPILAAAARMEGKGKSLVWLERTDGTLSLPITDLAPALYIDCARRIRLSRKEDQQLYAYYATSQAARIAGDEVAGRTGDPFAPMKRDASASITPKRETFGYRGLARVLKSSAPVLAQVHDSDDEQGLAIGLSALVRRGGTDTNTDGFFDKAIPTSRIKELGRAGRQPLDRVADVADRRAAEAGEAGDRLRRALISLVQGGPKEPRWNDEAAKKKVGPWIEAYDRAVASVFFGKSLWDEAASVPENHRLIWRTRLSDIADATFEQAGKAAPGTQMRRERGKALSRRMLSIELAKWLKEAEHG